MNKRLVLIVAAGVAAGVLVARLSGNSDDAPVVTPAPMAAQQARTGAVATTERAPLVFNRNKVRQRDLAASDPRYDPVKLLEEEEQTPQETFAAEPRDLKYAPIFEQRLKNTIEDVLRELNLQDKVIAIGVECKTLSCRTYIEVAKADGAAVYDQINGILMGNVQEPGLVDDEDPTHMDISLFNIYEPGMRDESEYKKFLAFALPQNIALAKSNLQKKQAHETPR